MNLKKLAVIAALPLAMLSAPSMAATWETGELVKIISEGATIITSIGTAILSVVVLMFGFRMARRMLGA